MVRTATVKLECQRTQPKIESANFFMFFHIQALAKAKDVPNQHSHSPRRQILIEIRVAKRQMLKRLRG
jgi:hypothetical protein